MYGTTTIELHFKTISSRYIPVKCPSIDYGYLLPFIFKPRLSLLHSLTINRRSLTAKSFTPHMLGILLLLPIFDQDEEIYTTCALLDSLLGIAYFF